MEQCFELEKYWKKWLEKIFGKIQFLSKHCSMKKQCFEFSEQSYKSIIQKTQQSYKNFLQNNPTKNVYKPQQSYKIQQSYKNT